MLPTRNDVIVVLIAAVLTFGCASTDPSGEGAKPATDGLTYTDEQNQESPLPETEDSESQEYKAGTRDNPLPLGTAARIGDWRVMVARVQKNANGVIAKANMYNEPPAKGKRYVMVLVKGTYVGTESGTFDMDLSNKFYGSGGNTFGEAGVVRPQSIHDTEEAFPGASVKGHMVYEVPVNQIAGGSVIIEESISFDDSDRTFFALE